MPRSGRLGKQRQGLGDGIAHDLRVGAGTSNAACASCTRAAAMARMAPTISLQFVQALRPCLDVR